MSHGTPHSSNAQCEPAKPAPDLIRGTSLGVGQARDELFEAAIPSALTRAADTVFKEDFLAADPGRS